MGNVLSYSCNGLGDKLLQSCADGDLISVRQVSLFDADGGVPKVGSRVGFHSLSESDKQHIPRLELCLILLHTI